MEIEQSVIDALIASPAEALNVEVKRWIDPSTNAGIEKIAKATLALRNRNGGYLVIGFDDNTLLPDTGNEPANIRATFHTDDIQAIVSRYSSELFEIGVAYSQRNGIDHPVIVVPPGVRTPVAAKRDLIDGTRTLIRNGAVYFRTLAANGTPRVQRRHDQRTGEKLSRSVLTIAKLMLAAFCGDNSAAEMLLLSSLLCKKLA